MGNLFSTKVQESTREQERFEREQERFEFLYKKFWLQPYRLSIEEEYELVKLFEELKPRIVYIISKMSRDQIGAIMSFGKERFDDYYYPFLNDEEKDVYERRDDKWFRNTLKFNKYLKENIYVMYIKAYLYTLRSSTGREALRKRKRRGQDGEEDLDKNNND